MDKIICKHCGKEIELSEALLHQVKEAAKNEFESAHKKDLEVLAREVEEKTKKSLIEKQKSEFELLEKELFEQKKKNDEFVKKELELRAEKRKIEEEKREMKLENERKLDAERKKIEEKAAKDEEERYRMKAKEKDMQIENLKKSLEEANRKASGVSQQVQGEVLEIDLEETLKKAFPTDSIEPIAKGVRGGDILQVVKNSRGKIAGSILWETKRAKWTPSWLPKLRDDARKIGATSSILVSEDTPKEIENFGFVDAVLVTSYSYTTALAIIVRRGIMQTAAAKAAAESKDESLEMVYQYLQSDNFRHRIEGYIESISTMKKDLDAERRAMERIWKRREMQITKAETSMARLSGELEGIMGSSFPTIKPLELEDE